jgi:hypothetical protein
MWRRGLHQRRLADEGVFSLMGEGSTIALMCCEILVNERAQRGQISIYSKIAFASRTRVLHRRRSKSSTCTPVRAVSVGAPTLTADLGPATN